MNKGMAYEVKYSESSFKESKYKKFTNAYPDFDLSLITVNKENDSKAIELIRL